MHNGPDFSAPEDTKISSPVAVDVVASKAQDVNNLSTGYGYFVTVKLSDNTCEEIWTFKKLK